MKPEMLQAADESSDFLATSELAEDRTDDLFAGLEDVRSVLEGVARFIAEQPELFACPDRLTVGLLGTARRTTARLAHDFGDTDFASRLMRLHGLVCAALVIGDTFDVAKNSAASGAEMPGLMHTVAVARILAEEITREVAEAI
ncbi:MAG: hypothetical protein H5U24_15365 [Thioclava marina]|uniref:hypothetical protein n=1 Tax=Thioclava marina TaxID=1915077 RepID=UPI0019A624D1|nr:hypothetical protein [Thioclava marina]MBC7146762.1 hypothetical protein [Thioclava marina]